MSMEFLSRELRKMAVAISPDVASVKAIKRAVIEHNVDSQRELPYVVRVGIAKPYFEEAASLNNGRAMPVGPDMIFYFNLWRWFGGDVLAQMIDDKLVEAQFDFQDRPRGVSLADYLRKMAKNEGWKQ